MSKEDASISTMLHFLVFGLRFYHKKDILEENLVSYKMKEKTNAKVMNFIILCA